MPLSVGGSQIDLQNTLDNDHGQSQFAVLAPPLGSSLFEGESIVLTMMAETLHDWTITDLEESFRWTWLPC